MKSDLQLFRLSHEIWDSMVFEDVVATYKDMHELNMAFSPFLKYAIETKIKFLKGMASDPEGLTGDIGNRTILFEYNFEKREIGEGNIMENPLSLHMSVFDENGKRYHEREDLIEYFKNHPTEAKEFYKKKSEQDGLYTTFLNICFDLHMVLIVLLATKNVKTDTMVNRNLLGGKSNKKNQYRKDYPYTTTISIGKITESHVGDGDDPRTVRPHLRRGHIRMQRFGPDRSFEKKIFIEPVFVNASQGWIAKRSAYNVSSKAWPDSRANV